MKIDQASPMREGDVYCDISLIYEILLDLKYSLKVRLLLVTLRKIPWPFSANQFHIFAAANKISITSFNYGNDITTNFTMENIPYNSGRNTQSHLFIGSYNHINYQLC